MSARHPDQGRLFALLDGRLGAEEQLALRIHVETCRDCSAQLAGLRRTHGALRELGRRMPVPPAENRIAEARLVQAIEKGGPPRRGIDWWWLPVTAAATLLLALLVLPRLRSTDDPGASVTATVAAPGTAASGAIATILRIRGDVTAGPSAQELHAGRAGEELRPGTLVRVGADAEIRLALAAGGELTLAAESTLVLPDDLEGLIRLESGTVDVRVTPRAEGRRPFGVETPLARVEAIGTVFRVVHETDATTVEVTEGKVRFVSLRSDAEQLVLAGRRVAADEAGRLTETQAVGTVAAAPPEPLSEPEPAAVEPEPGELAAGELVAGAPVRIARPRGTIDEGRVRARVSRQRGALQACYSDYVMRGSPQPVEARVRFVVLENGSVGEVQTNLSVADVQLDECIERVFRAVEFPRPRGGPARVFYPIKFSL